MSNPARDGRGCREGSGHRSHSRVASIVLVVTLIAVVAVQPSAAASADPPPAGDACDEQVQVREGTSKNPLWTSISPPVFPPDALAGGFLQPNAIFSYAVDPVNPNRIFAADLDTVMRSTDGGCHWEAVFSLWEPTVDAALPGCPGISGEYVEASSGGCSRIYSIHIPPAANGPGRVYLQVASKLNAYLPQSGMTTIFVSENGGDSFSAWRDPSPDGVASLVGVGELAIAPSDPQTLYLLRGNGVSSLFSSNDGGHTWQRRSSTQSTTIESLAVNPTEPSELWSVMLVNPGQAPKLYRRSVLHSTDSGATWQEVKGPFDDPYRVAVAATAGKSPSLAVSSAGSKVFLSGDGGQAWQELPLSTLAQSPCSVPEFGFGRNPTWFFVACDEQQVIRFDSKRGLATRVKNGLWSDPDSYWNVERLRGLRYSPGTGLSLMLNCGISNDGPCMIARYQGRGT